METKSTAIIPGKDLNVGNQERIISALSGSLMLFNGLRKGKFIQGLAGGYLLFRGATGYCPIFEISGKSTTGKKQNVNIKTHITVNKPVSEVYQFWRQLDNLPLFMNHLESVTILDQTHSEWKARIPGGTGTIGWTSEIVEDQPNDRIGWRSLPDSTIENAGNVHFRDAGKFGTNVYAVISYQAPGGKVGEEISRLINPAFKKMVQEDLKNFKHYMESQLIHENGKAPSWQE